MRLIRPGTWELRVTIGRWEDGRPRTLNRTVSANGEAEAAAQLVALVDELSGAQLPDTRDDRDLTVDEAIERFLTEYLAKEKGRADKTIGDYRNLHQRWFSPAIGARPVKRIESSVMDDLFGQMRQAGLSASRLNHAKSLYVPFFRWAKRLRNPMIDFEMPTSTYRSKERTPPEVEELTLLLATAVEVTPEIALLLVLGAVTGTRRGELVAIPRSAVSLKKKQITVDTAISSTGKVKSTKTRRGRTFHVDGDTIAMLQRHCVHMDERARAAGVAATGVRVPLVAVVVDPTPGLAPAQVPADRSGPLIRTMVDSEFTGEGQLDHRRCAVRVCRRRPAPEKVSSLSPTMPSSLPTAEHQAPLERSHD